MRLEAELWREVCQHLELDESVQRVAAILANHFPLQVLLIRRLDRDPSIHLTTVAAGSPEDPLDAQPWPARSEFDGSSARELIRFLSRAEPVVVTESDSPLGRALVPRGLEGVVVAAPLAAQGKPVGVALLAVGRGTTVDPEHLEILRSAIAPLRVAFENDQRLHELARMREALEADRAALLSRLQRQDISDVVIGESGGLRRVMERVEQVASTDAPVLLLGETGSGKEVIARAIHARSKRAKGPVVRVNCGAIPSELVDSELFGHERGSFTGAVGTRKGWFERADGGTLFLDEIGELPLAAQVRLLRVLQDGTLERVGGHQTISVDVRIVAATHRHLESMVSEGAFREDLWYRLSVFPIRLPALRERIEDLPALAAHFAEGAGKRLGGAGLAPTSADIELLRSYAWPGNVRELAAVIERAAILGDGKRLELAAALGATSLVALSRPALGRAVEPPTNGSDGPQDIVTLDGAMAAHIRRALVACRGRIEGPFGAAKLLGINPHTLRSRMRKLGVEWSQFRDQSLRFSTQER
jgi:transcriptional regulator with GAF, ATPase, and Fis domain